jgi:hypothetical protein
VTDPLVRLDERCFPSFDIEGSSTCTAPETMSMVQLGWSPQVVFWHSDELGSVPVQQ